MEKEAELIYEFEFEDEGLRDDWDMMCSSCGALVLVGDRENVEYVRNFTYYCYNCGSRFVNVRKVEG